MNEWLANMNASCKGTLAEALGIEITECDKTKVVATMPVDHRTRQPLGYLHGGASVALAETVVSIGGWMHAADEGKVVLGLEINANHLRSVRDGKVTAVGTPIHVGKTSQVWEVKILNDAGKPVCVSRCTLAVVAPKI